MFTLNKIIVTDSEQRLLRKLESDGEVPNNILHARHAPISYLVERGVSDRTITCLGAALTSDQFPDVAEDVAREAAFRQSRGIATDDLDEYVRAVGQAQHNPRTMHATDLRLLN
ncbi:MAG: hypothetical protein PHZ00_07105 [Candidatus Peribacteraceae bacterium]|nr:hypothetical protein [Candidatus Peribacteraceae bacterium]